MSGMWVKTVYNRVRDELSQDVETFGTINFISSVKLRNFRPRYSALNAVNYLDNFKNDENRPIHFSHDIKDRPKLKLIILLNDVIFRTVYRR